MIIIHLTTQHHENAATISAKPPTSVESVRFSKGTEYRVKIDNTIAIKIEKYDEFYSANWQSHLSTAKEAIKTLYNTLQDKIPSECDLMIHNPSSLDYEYISLKSSQINTSELDGIIYDNVKFFRIEVDEFSITWKCDQSGSKTTLGFISEDFSMGNFLSLIKLYERTAKYVVDIKEFKQSIGNGLLWSSKGLQNDSIKEHIRKAKTRVVIINTYAPNLELLMGSIIEALKRDVTHKLQVEIFLLNPNSPLTRERTASLSTPPKSPVEIKPEEDVVKQGIIKNLDLLEEMVKSYPEILDSRLKVRLYNSLPSVSVYRADEYYCIGLYMHGSLAINNIQFITDKDENFKDVVSSETAYLSDQESIGESISIPVDKLVNWSEQIERWCIEIKRRREEIERKNSRENSGINLDEDENENIKKFENHNFFHIIDSIPNEDFLKMLIQRRFISLAFTQVYDMVIDALNDNDAKIIARKILREEYPNRKGEKPSHRELLIHDFNILKASMGIEDSHYDILKTPPTIHTTNTIEDTFTLIRDNSTGKLSDIKLLTILRFWGEVLVSVEYGQYWRKRMKKFFYTNAENASRFYYEHFSHDAKKAKKESMEKHLSEDPTHSDELGRYLWNMIKTVDDRNAFIEMEDKVLKIKSNFYNQFTDQTNPA